VQNQAAEIRNSDETQVPNGTADKVRLKILTVRPQRLLINPFSDQSWAEIQPIRNIHE